MATRLNSIALASLFLLAGCGSGSSPETSATEQATTTPHPASIIDPDPAKIEAMKALIKAEPKVIDFIYDPSAVVQWTIGRKPDGSSQIGYAEYFCTRMSMLGLPLDRVIVRIVDYAKYLRLQGDAREASLGAVDCASGQQFGP